MISTGAIDAMAAIMRKGMTGARLPIMVLPMARKVSGESEAIDRLRPSHGPQNTPATKAHKKMLTNCQTLSFITASVRFQPAQPRTLSVVLDHHLSKRLNRFVITKCVRNLAEGKNPVDHRPQMSDCNRTIHRDEVGTAACGDHANGCDGIVEHACVE